VVVLAAALRLVEAVVKDEVIRALVLGALVVEVATVELFRVVVVFLTVVRGNLARLLPRWFAANSNEVKSEKGESPNVYGCPFLFSASISCLF
jgi:hypothetical protein